MKKLFYLALALIMINFVFCGYLYSQDPEPDCVVVLDPSLMDKNENVAAAWLAYALTRSLWYNNYFFEEFPNEAEYRYTLEEEFASRSEMAIVWADLKEKDPTLNDPYLDELLLVSDSGYMNEYVFIYFNSPGWKAKEDFRIEDFKKWMKENVPEHRPETLSGISPTTD